MITHFTITPQCLDCDNPEAIVFTITVTNDTEEAAEDVLLGVGPGSLGTLIDFWVAEGYGSATHGTWSAVLDAGSVWSIPLLGSQETATTTITVPPGVESTDFCGPEISYLPLTFVVALSDYPTTPPVSATLQLCEDPPPPPPPPSLQPPGSGRNTPIARVSERNGLTVFFPGETDRTCIQDTCPVAVGGGPEPEPECADFIIEADDQGWGPRNTLYSWNMSDLPEDFIPGSGESPLLLVLGATTVEFYWDEGSEAYRNTDYLANLSGEEWPEASFMWGEGAVACVNVSFVPPSG